MKELLEQLKTDSLLKDFNNQDVMMGNLDQAVDQRDSFSTLIKMNLNKTKELRNFIEDGGDAVSYFRGFEQGMITAAFLFQLNKKSS